MGFGFFSVGSERCNSNSDWKAYRVKSMKCKLLISIIRNFTTLTLKSKIMKKKQSQLITQHVHLAKLSVYRSSYNRVADFAKRTFLVNLCQWVLSSTDL